MGNKEEVKKKFKGRNELVAEDKYEEALERYTHALEQRPDDPSILSKRGLTLHKLRQYDEALKNYNRSLKLRPDDPGVLSNRGLTLHKLGRYDEALKNYNRSLKLRPNHGGVLSNRSKTLHKLGRYDEARNDYNRFIELRRSHRNMLGNDHRPLGKDSQFSRWNNRRTSPKPAALIDNEEYKALYELDEPDMTLLKYTSDDIAVRVLCQTEKQYKRIVAKFGTNLLTAGTDKIDKNVLSSIVRQVASLHKEGKELILVSSGAVASGRQLLSLEIEKLLKENKTEPDPETLKSLNQVALYALIEIRNELAHKQRNPNILKNLDELLAKHRRDIPTRQVMAAMGQHVLMNYYTELFRQHNIFTAQALLTKLDLANRVGYLNARNTLLALLEAGVVPIINENDVVATDELEGARFGDNDNLSGMVANLVDADLLVIMSDVKGLYTADPSIDKEAKLIPVVKEIDKNIEKMAGGTRGRGTGGMTTKIQAAKLATASGTAVVVANGSEPDLLLRLVNGESVGTTFLPSTDKLESRKRWILSGLATKGQLVVDGGAAAALSKGNKSLLPAGVRGVEGSFKRGDAVDIVNEAGDRIASGISNYSAADIEKIKGARSDKIEGLLGHVYGDEVVHRDNIVII